LIAEACPMINEVFVCKVKFHFLNLLFPLLLFLLGTSSIVYSRYSNFIAEKIKLSKEITPGFIGKTTNMLFGRFLAQEEASLKQSKYNRGQLFLAIGCLLLLPLFFTIWYYIFRKVIITNKRIYVRQGILCKNMQDILIGRISIIRIRQSLLQKLFDIGHLYIYAGAGAPIKLKNTRGPFSIKKHIENLTNP
jgi:membrane protein YdbS with pleckstrin-like domain